MTLPIIILVAFIILWILIGVCVVYAGWNSYREFIKTWRLTHPKDVESYGSVGLGKATNGAERCGADSI